MHQHLGQRDKCNCAAGDKSDSDDEIDEKVETHNHQKRHSRIRAWLDWVRPPKPKKLPTYLDRDHDGNMDEYVSAHSGTSDLSPVKPIRTLHRYESAQIPEHTAWMERHSALSQENLAVSVEQGTSVSWAQFGIGNI
jgi:hypothetical protein